jgi:hypothetical protein
MNHEGRGRERFQVGVVPLLTEAHDRLAAVREGQAAVQGGH